MTKGLEELLNKKNIRPTAMRLLMRKVLSGKKSAMSLSEVEKSFDKSDRITLY